MSKENGDLYFSHDFNSSNDEKMIAFLSLQGAEGYGVFWLIVEQMHKNEGIYKKKDYNYLATAERSQATAERIKAILNDLVDCELFYEDDEGYYSERVIKNLEKSKKISVTNAQNARQRKAKKSDRSTTASDRSTTADILNKTKEDKRKEEKKNNKKEIPTSDEVSGLFYDYLKSLMTIENIDKEKTEGQIRAFIRYYIGDEDQKGKWILAKKGSNPKSCVKNWVDKNVNAFKNFKKPDITESVQCTGWENMIELYQKKLSGVHIGRLIEHLKTNDQNGFYEGKGFDWIYKQGLAKAENFKIKEANQ